MNHVLFYDDPRCEAHDQGGGHPESPARIRAVREAVLGDAVLAPWIRSLPARPASREELLRVHTPQYVAVVESTCMDSGPAILGPDVRVCRGSWTAALLAAGGACDAVEQVLAGRTRAAFCNLRPPGHHARPDEALGFCVFNNVAVAAHAALAAGVERVAIVDWDVHHGNGVQEVFWDDGRVFYASLHQSPFYPGTGARSQTGAGAGQGRILNVPLPPHTPKAFYRQAWEADVLPALRAFAPGLILVSAGFDAHVDDPIGGLTLDAAFFHRLTADLVAVGQAGGCRGVVSLLEGGYDLAALAASVVDHLRALAGGPARETP